MQRAIYWVFPIFFFVFQTDSASFQSNTRSGYRYSVDTSGHNFQSESFGHEKNKAANRNTLQNQNGKWQYWFSSRPHEPQTDHGQTPDKNQPKGQLKSTSINSGIYNGGQTGQQVIYSSGQRENTRGYSSGQQTKVIEYSSGQQAKVIGYSSGQQAEARGYIGSRQETKMYIGGKEATGGNNNKYTGHSTNYNKFNNYNIGLDGGLADQNNFENYESNGNAIPGVPGQDYPTYSDIPQTSFTCQNRVPGYYADVETSCQAYHVCSDGGILTSFLCPNGSIFNQQVLVCDWYFSVNCESSPQFYHLNDQIGVDDHKGYSDVQTTSGNGYRNGKTDYGKVEIGYSNNKVRRNYKIEKIGTGENDYFKNIGKLISQGY